MEETQEQSVVAFLGPAMNVWIYWFFCFVISFVFYFIFTRHEHECTLIYSQ